MEKSDSLEAVIEKEELGQVKTPKSSRRYIGILLCLISSSFFSLAAIIVKMSAKRFHPFVLAAWTFQGLFFPSIFVLLYCWKVKEIPVFLPFDRANGGRKIAWLLFARCIVGASTYCVQFLALRYIDLGDALVIGFSTPVFVTLIAHRFLNEKCGIVPFVAIVITIAGMVVVARPPMLTGKNFEMNNLIGMCLSFGGMIGLGICFVLLRYLRKVHFSMVLLCYGGLGIVECYLAAHVMGVRPSEWFPSTGKDWLVMTGLMSLGFFAQMLLALSLKFEQATIISTLRTCDVIFGFMWQYFFLSVVPDIFSVIGGSVVISGVLLIGVRKWVFELPEGDKTKVSLWFMLK